MTGGKRSRALTAAGSLTRPCRLQTSIIAWRIVPLRPCLAVLQWPRIKLSCVVQILLYRFVIHITHGLPSRDPFNSGHLPWRSGRTYIVHICIPIPTARTWSRNCRRPRYYPWWRRSRMLHYKNATLPVRQRHITASWD